MRVHRRIIDAETLKERGADFLVCPKCGEEEELIPGKRRSREFCAAVEVFSVGKTATKKNKVEWRDLCSTCYSELSDMTKVPGKLDVNLPGF